MRNSSDIRKYEMALSSAAEDYEKQISEWILEHKYFIAARWGQKFHGLFLDYGCGTGLVARNLVRLGREVVATDISKNMCRITKDICGVQVVVADGLNLPFKRQAFSVICVSGVLHHLRQQLENAFFEIGRCASKGICIVEPSSKPPHLILRLLFFLHRAYGGLLYRTVYKNMRGKYKYSIFEGPLDPEKLIELLENQGFQVSELRFFNHFPYFPPFPITILPERLRKHLVRSMLSSTRGTDVEIIAKRC